MPVNWFDVAVLVFLSWGAVNGYFRGLTLSLYNILAWMFSLGLAFYSKSAITGFVNRQYQAAPILSRVLSQNVNLPMKVSGSPGPGEELPGFIQSLPVGTSAKNSLWEYFYREGEQLLYQGGSPAEFLYSWLAEAIVQIISFAAVFALIILMLRLVEGAWTLQKKGKLLPEVNSFSGMIVGVLKGVFSLLIITAIVSPVLEVLEVILLEDIYGSFSLKFLRSLLSLVWGGY